MKLLEYAWFKDIQTCIEELKELAMGEDWDCLLYTSDAADEL